MSAYAVRLLRLDELDAAHALNQSEVPRVGDATRDRLIQLLAWADVAVGAERDGHLVGFALAMGPYTSYDSPNYRWFADRHEDFLYIDRVVVHQDARGRGIAAALYDAVFDARPAPWMTAEVNLEPPNPTSMRFHQRYGFSEIDRLERGPGHVVAMLAKACEVPVEAEVT